MNDSRLLPAAQPSGERIPGRRSTPRSHNTLRRWIAAAALAVAVCGAIQHAADFPADGRGMASADGASSVDPVDDSSQEPLLAVPTFRFALPGKDRAAFLSGTLRRPSLSIAPPAPPPKI